jgi:hypothetical protein
MTPGFRLVGCAARQGKIDAFRAAAGSGQGASPAHAAAPANR